MGRKLHPKCLTGNMIKDYNILFSRETKKPLTYYFVDDSGTVITLPRIEVLRRYTGFNDINVVNIYPASPVDLNTPWTKFYINVVDLMPTIELAKEQATLRKIRGISYDQR